MGDFIIHHILSAVLLHTYILERELLCGLVTLTAWIADRLHPHLDIQGESGRYLPC